MRRTRLIVLLMLLPIWAAADACFDFDAWKTALINGETAQAEAIIAKATTDCGCQSDVDKCIALPGQTILATPTWLRETITRFDRWRQEMSANCGALPEKKKLQRETKAKCYQKRAQAFSEGLAGETYGSLLRPIPITIAENYVERLGVGDDPDDRSQSLEERYGREIAGIGRRICKLTEELHKQEILLQQVRRRGQFNQAEKVRREKELIESIKNLRDLIRDLRDKFQRLSGESFDPFTFCADQGGL